MNPLREHEFILRRSCPARPGNAQAASRRRPQAGCDLLDMPPFGDAQDAKAHGISYRPMRFGGPAPRAHAPPPEWPAAQVRRHGDELAVRR